MRLVGNRYHHTGLNRLRQEGFLLHPGLLTALTALPLVLDLLVGDVIHHCRRRFHIVLFFLIPVIPGPVDDCPDNAGNGDLHGTQYGNHRKRTQQDVGHPASAGPVNNHSNSTAEHTAAASVDTAGVKLGNQRHSLGRHFRLNHQMMDTAAEEHTQYSADAAHFHSGFSCKGMENKQIQQRGNRKVKPHLSNQSENNGLEEHHQSASRRHSHNRENHKQQQTDNGNNSIDRQLRLIVFCFHRLGFGLCAVFG